jgi:hypothetical protein
MEEDRIGSLDPQRSVALERKRRRRKKKNKKENEKEKKNKIRANTWCSVPMYVSSSDFLITKHCRVRSSYQ